MVHSERRGVSRILGSGDVGPTSKKGLEQPCPRGLGLGLARGVGDGRDAMRLNAVRVRAMVFSRGTSAEVSLAVSVLVPDPPPASFVTRQWAEYCDRFQ